MRAFLRALTAETSAAGAGVLLVAHDTKAARNAAARGEDPGAGVVAGSAAWYDGARGVLVLARSLLVGLTAQEQEPGGWAAVIVRTLEQCEHSNTIRGSISSTANTYAAALQGRAPGRRPTAASRQGRKRVGAYVSPGGARQLRVLAAQEDTSTQAPIEQAIELLFRSRA